MTEIEIINVPSIKREVKIDKATRQKLLSQVKEEAQVNELFNLTSKNYSDAKYN